MHESKSRSEMNVVVIGSGTMGSGIAYVSAASGHNVVVVEQDQKLLDSGMKRVGEYVERAISRGHITKDQASTINAKLRGTLDFNAACRNANLVVEAVFEDPIVKEKVFTTIDKFSPKEAILASNTSSISITRLGGATHKPDRVLGLHFFNPVPTMKLVELIKGNQTSESTVKTARSRRASMTTDETPRIDDPSKRLTEMILKGEDQESARIASEIVGGRSETNDIVDAISETMNIVADLHEVERYTVQQVESCERAAESALNAIRPGLKVEQRRISGKVMVTSLYGDPHRFDKTLLLTMLEMGGFSALDGGEELSPEEVVRNVKNLKPDVLAIPLVTTSAVNDLLRTRSLLANSGVKTKLVTYGRGVAKLPSDSQLSAMEEDSLSILSRIAEILISR